MRWLERFSRLCAACIVLVVAGCTANPSAQLESPLQVDLRAKRPGAVDRREGAALSTGASGSQQFFPGSSASLEEGRLDPPPGVSEQEGKFSLNLDRADINEASRLVLGRDAWVELCRRSSRSGHHHAVIIASAVVGRSARCIRSGTTAQWRGFDPERWPGQGRRIAGSARRRTRRRRSRSGVEFSRLRRQRPCPFAISAAPT